MPRRINGGWFLGLALSAIASSGLGQTLLNDNFNDGVIALGWVTPAGTWNESGGRLHGTNTAADTPIEIYWQPGLSWTDYAAEVDVIPLSLHDPSDAQLNIRYVGPNERCICAVFRGNIGDNLYLIAPGQAVQYYPFSFSPGQSYRLRATAVGQTIICEIVNQPQTRLTTVSSGSATGTVALRNTHIAADFDDLVVTDLAASPIEFKVDFRTFIPGLESDGTGFNHVPVDSDGCLGLVPGVTKKQSRRLAFASDDRSYRRFDSSPHSFRTRQAFTTTPDRPLDQSTIESAQQEVGETKVYAFNALTNDANPNGLLDDTDDDDTSNSLAINDCSLLHGRGFACCPDGESCEANPITGIVPPPCAERMGIAEVRVAEHRSTVFLAGLVANPFTSLQRLPAESLLDPIVDPITFLYPPARDWEETAKGVLVSIKWGLRLEIDTSGSVPRFTLHGLHSGFPAFEIYINDELIHCYTPGPPPYGFWSGSRLLTPSVIVNRKGALSQGMEVGCQSPLVP